jgi:hypothetical protein
MKLPAKSILIGIVAALVSVACGGSTASSTQPSALTPTPSGSGPPLRLELDGLKSLSAIGETDQLTVLGVWPDGSKRDVTSMAEWSSRNASIATVSPGGMATAVGFGIAAIEVKYQSVSRVFQISVTPAGTFAATGAVSEPGLGAGAGGIGGALAGVRVLEPVSGRSTITDQSGNYMLVGLARPHLRFEMDGYETGDLDLTPDGLGYMRMQRIVRITAGETALIPKLTHMDVSWDVGGDRCWPCRLVRIVVPAAGTMHFDLTWEPNPGSDVYLWAGGQRFAKDANSQQHLSADAPVTAGENVIYVGYYQWTFLQGSSIKLALATSLNP